MIFFPLRIASWTAGFSCRHGWIWMWTSVMRFSRSRCRTLSRFLTSSPFFTFSFRIFGGSYCGFRASSADTRRSRAGRRGHEIGQLERPIGWL